MKKKKDKGPMMKMSLGMRKEGWDALLKQLPKNKEPACEVAKNIRELFRHYESMADESEYEIVLAQSPFQSCCGPYDL